MTAVRPAAVAAATHARPVDPIVVFSALGSSASPLGRFRTNVGGFEDSSLAGARIGGRKFFDVVLAERKDFLESLVTAT